MYRHGVVTAGLCSCSNQQHGEEFHEHRTASDYAVWTTSHSEKNLFTVVCAHLFEHHRLRSTVSSIKRTVRKQCKCLSQMSVRRGMRRFILPTFHLVPREKHWTAYFTHITSDLTICLAFITPRPMLPLPWTGVVGHRGQRLPFFCRDECTEETFSSHVPIIMILITREKNPTESI